MIGNRNLPLNSRHSALRRLNSAEALEPRMLLAVDALEFGRHLTLDTATMSQPPAASTGRWHRIEAMHLISAETSLSSVREVIFVDRGIDDYPALIESLGLDDRTSGRFELVLLDTNRDGVEQITEHLRDRSNLEAIHILSHGTSGELSLGNSRLKADSLSGYAQEWDVWRSALGRDADVLLYGCNVAEGQWGLKFVAIWAKLRELMLRHR